MSAMQPRTSAPNKPNLDLGINGAETVKHYRGKTADEIKDALARAGVNYANSISKFNVREDAGGFIVNVTVGQGLKETLKFTSDQVGLVRLAEHYYEQIDAERRLLEQQKQMTVLTKIEQIKQECGVKELTRCDLNGDKFTVIVIDPVTQMLIKHEYDISNSDNKDVYAEIARRSARGRNIL
jgi:hypothetical protein